jgi:hypothetical protein
MNPVLDALLRAVEASPIPAEHASSHWQFHGRQTTVEPDGPMLRLRASGFNPVAQPGLAGHLLHRVERWSYRAVTAHLKSFPEIWALTRQLLRELGGGPDFYAFRSACALATLADHWQAFGLDPKVFALIGDGSGLLGAMIRRARPTARLYCIDLPKTLVFQVRTHERANPSACVALLSGEDSGEAPTAAAADIAFVLPQALEQIPDAIDCAINIASMQEMLASSIAAYFTFLRRRSAPQARFYCVNRRRKELRGGEITSFYDYPWQPDDEVFVDGPCPYYRHFFSSSTLPHGPRLFGVRVPYVNWMDGEHVHRLARLAPESARGDLTHA